MKIQNKIFLLHAALIAVFTAGLMYLRDVERGRLELIATQEKLERKDVFARIIEMTASNAEGMVRDYSLWDEMVAFVSTGDKQWAKSNIDGGLENFDLDLAWIYNLNNQVIHVLSGPGLPDFSRLPLPSADISEIFRGSAFVDFYVNTQSGIMDIRGASIHNISDPERKDPQGYIFVARILDQEFLDSLGALTGTRVSMDGLGNGPAEGANNTNAGEISFEFPLEGLDRNAVARLHVSFHSDMLVQADAISRNVTVLIFIFLITIFVLVTLALISWVNLPLRSISMALAREDATPIDGLANKANEMGDIARLIKQFFRQKHKLSLEIQERELTEQNLQKAYQDLKTMQNQLFQSEKMSSIGQLAAGVAHEINNPVGFINNNIDVLSEYVAGYKRIFKAVEVIKAQVDAGDIEKVKDSIGQLKALEAEINFDFINEDVSKLVEHCNRGLERIRRIVIDLRTFARADSEETKETVKIEDVIEGILSIVQSEFKAKAELIKEYGDTQSVLCNSQRIGQVLINILVNATQAIKDKGKIIIKTYEQGQFVCVDISDTGCGIPPENIKRLFDPFFTTKPVGQGTGLGLSVSYEIVKKHGGEIKVRSKAGDGTTFTVMIPVNE